VASGGYLAPWSGWIIPALDLREKVMTVGDLLRRLSYFPGEASVAVQLDGRRLPLTGLTTYGGDLPHTVALFVDATLTVRLCTREESEKLDALLEEQP
jgi:hypothetical protein